MTDVLITPDALERELEERAVPLRAIYEHWERNRWSVFSVDYSCDREAFLALDEEGQRRLRWLFAHRFDGESLVARLLAPFLTAAPSFEMSLLISTQIADELRHVQAVLRVYEEVLGVSGGFDAAQRMADAHRDPITGSLYARLEHYVHQLDERRDEDAYLQAVMAYHVVGEGILARVSTNLANGVFEGWGTFPGLLESQKLVLRDEARHIGIGVTYARQRVAADRERAGALIGEVLADVAGLFAAARDRAESEIADDVRAGYGASPAEYHAEVVRLTQVRLRAIGLLD